MLTHIGQVGLLKSLSRPSKRWPHSRMLAISFEETPPDEWIMVFLKVAKAEEADVAFDDHHIYLVWSESDD